MNICQRIVSQVGRRVDEASPICDARLADGSRVNVIAPPLAIDGPSLTIRKFKKDKLTLDQLVNFGSITPEGAELLQIIGRVRCNTIISGGTGSGKTTLLNCLTRYIDVDERIITCEDSAELQLQQASRGSPGDPAAQSRGRGRNHHARTGEKLSAHAPGGGSSSARCADRKCSTILQAMNTGHDGLNGNHSRQQPARMSFTY